MPNTKHKDQARALPDLLKDYLEDRIQRHSFELPMLPRVASQVMEM